MNSVGRACYVERNQCMVDDSDFVIFFFDLSHSIKSGIYMAYEYVKRIEDIKIRLDDERLTVIQIK